MPADYIENDDEKNDTDVNFASFGARVEQELLGTPRKTKKVRNKNNSTLQTNWEKRQVKFAKIDAKGLNEDIRYDQNKELVGASETKDENQLFKTQFVNGNINNVLGKTLVNIRGRYSYSNHLASIISKST